MSPMTNIPGLERALTRLPNERFRRAIAGPTVRLIAESPYHRVFPGGLAPVQTHPPAGHAAQLDASRCTDSQLRAVAAIVAARFETGEEEELRDLRDGARLMLLPAWFDRAEGRPTHNETNGKDDDQ